jgi:hypothetical protein
MNDLDISQYFSQFSPSPKQIKKIFKLLKSVHKWWGVDPGDSFIEATLLLAPGDLSQLSLAAYKLLKRCQNRIWAFNINLDDKFDLFSKQTYLSLFDLLISLNLIVEASLPSKIIGSKKVDDLRRLLKEKGLSDKGTKKELSDRLIQNFSAEELESLVNGIVLFHTTCTGDKAIKNIAELRWRVGLAFQAAKVGTMDYFETIKEPTPTFPAGVYYEDGVVRITEEDIARANELPHSIHKEDNLAETNKQENILTPQLIHDFVNDIESSGGGWFTVLVTNDNNTNFIQCSFGNPSKQWYFDASGDINKLSNLGFVKNKDGLLPMKWVSKEKITENILDTLKNAFNVGLGATVWIDYEITGETK